MAGPTIKNIRDLQGLRFSVSDAAGFTAAGRLSGGLIPQRPLLDTLGVGLEQAMAHLGAAHPDQEAFVASTEATGGGICGAAIKTDLWRLKAATPDDPANC